LLFNNLNIIKHFAHSNLWHFLCEIPVLFICLFCVI